MKLKFGSIKNKSSLYQFSLIFMVLMLIDCALTYSPYSAFHSGRVGTYSSSIVFFFNAAYILLVGLIIVLIVNRRIYKNNIVYLLCMIMIITGLCNGGLLRDTNTYIMDVVTLFITGTMAYDDNIRTNYEKAYSHDEKSDFELFYRAFILITVIGLLLAIILPGRFGIITFQFSRASRGEVTIWQLFSVPAVVTSIVLIRRSRGDKSNLDMALLILMWIIILSTANRTQVLVLAICLIMYWAEKRMNAKKIGGLFLALVAFFVGYSYITNFFLLGQTEINSNTISTILTGRWGLWKYYWDIFLSNMFLGYGPVSIDATLRRTLGASSEIGILKTVTSYGIVFGIVELYIIVKAVINGIRIINNNEKYSSFDNLIVYLFFTSIVLILQQHARILNYSDFLFYYSIIYLYAKGSVKGKGSNLIQSPSISK